MKSTIAVALAVAAWGSPVSAETLWQNVDVGMTLEQVKRAQPAASVPFKKESIKDGWATCELQLATYEVISNEFSVCFYMREGKLVQVMMTAKKPTIPLFGALVELLRAKYGPEMGPSPDHCRRTGSLNQCKAQWATSGSVNISALYMDIGGDVPLLNINYQTTLKSESGKL